MLFPPLAFLILARKNKTYYSTMQGSIHGELEKPLKSAAFTCSFISVIVIGLAQVCILVFLIKRLPAVFTQILAVVVLTHESTSPDAVVKG
jgi:hypothetical protein